MLKALFLDRDGIVNDVVKKYSRYYNKTIDDSPFNVNELKFNKGIKKLVNLARKKGYKIIIATNQPSVLKGDFTLREYEDITTKICNHLKLSREDVFTCFHREGYSLICKCRKPEPGLLLMAKGMFNLDLPNSFLLGDSTKDILAGKSVGTKTIYFIRKKNKFQIGNKTDLTKMNSLKINPDYIVESLEEVNHII